MNRTGLGVAIKAVGDNPNSVDAQGLSVYGLRIGAIVVGSALMALGGAFLTMSAFDAFFFGMVNGRGWICIALVIFASWKPGKLYWVHYYLVHLMHYKSGCRPRWEPKFPPRFFLQRLTSFRL